MKKIFSKKLTIQVLGISGIILLILLFIPSYSFLEYYMDGLGLKKLAFTAHSRAVLWEESKALKGKLNEVQGNVGSTVSEDGKTIIISRYFSSDNRDLFISRCIDKKWTKPRRLLNVNTEYNEITPSLSSDGKYLFFASDRPEGRGGFDIYVSCRRGQTWQAPYPVSSSINTHYDEKNPYLTVDKQVFYFNSNRPETAPDNPRDDTGKENFDIFSSFVEEIFENEDASLYLKLSRLKRLDSINTEYDEGHISATLRGNIIYFSSNRRGGYGGYDIYRSYLLREGFTDPENLGETVNSVDDEISPDISKDGYELFFSTNRRSWEKTDFLVFSSDSTEVVNKFDYSLLLKLLAMVLLILIIAAVIWALLRLLASRTDMSLIVKSLIIALIIHLLLALLSGLWFLGGQLSEAMKKKNRDMTININTLARQSVALAVREGISSLPKVKSVATTEKPVEKITVPEQQPVSSSEVSEIWREAEIVKPNSSPVNVKKSVHSEKAKTYTSDKEDISKVKPVKFGSSQVSMEVPEGTGSKASAETKGKSKGLPSVEQPVEKRRKERAVVEEIAEPSFHEMKPMSLTADEEIKELRKNMTRNAVAKSRATLSSTEIEENISSLDADGVLEDVSDFSGDDREIDGMRGSKGGFLLKTAFVMSTPDKEKFNQLHQLGVIKFNREFTEKRSADFRNRKVIITVPVNTALLELYRNMMEFKSFRRIDLNYKTAFSEDIGDMLYKETPVFLIQLDSEMEVPERYLDM
ncbi:MAG: hypothetical protein K9L78_02940 [Victivallales bacterium]|nr:hypothetical protein [Victivallales bacterium]MCF7889053.1 hypothetical protein [Victivallales bacterium]